jgi:hypothetical protein
MTALNLWPRITSVPLGTALIGDINPDTAAATKSFLLSEAIKAATADNQILVAASDSPAGIKAIANHVCDGTADEVQINAAIAALPATGGIVQLGPGTFCAEGINLVAGVQIRGCGIRSGTIIKNPATPGAAIFSMPGAADVFEGGGIFDVYLDGIDASMNGIDFTDCTKIDEFFIERCMIENCAVGIQGTSGLGNDRFLTINDTLIWNCTTGAYLSEHPRLNNVDFRLCTVGLTGRLNDAQISFCKFPYCTTGVEPAAGKTIGNSQFFGCVFFNCTTALRVNGANSICNNLFEGNAAATPIGISISASGNVISGNLIGTATKPLKGGAIVFANPTTMWSTDIVANQIYCYGVGGIVATGGGNVLATSIAGNTFSIDESSYGCDFDACLLRSAVFSGNTFKSGASAVGVRLKANNNSYGNVFVANTFQAASSVTATGIDGDMRASIVCGNRADYVSTLISVRASDTNTRIWGNSGGTNDPADRLLIQGTPAAIADGDTAITAANILTGICTMESSTAGRAPTVPTGTAVNGVVLVGQYIDWTFINTGDQTVTITAAAGHSLVGGMAIAAGTSGRFRTRCSAANTAITYKL